MLIQSDRCHYAASLAIFLQTSKAEWLYQMKGKNSSLTSIELQVKAWEDCYCVLVQVLPAILAKHTDLSILFEY